MICENKRNCKKTACYGTCVSSYKHYGISVTDRKSCIEKTTGNKNRIVFVTTETMKGKEYTEENMRLNRVTAVTTYKGQKTSLVPVYVYQNGKLMGSGKNCVPSRSLKYRSSKPGVASVNKKGVITPKKTGTVTITVSSAYNSKVKGTIEITVTSKAKALKATKKESSKAKFVLEASN